MELGGQFQDCWPFSALILAQAPSPRINFSSAFSPATNRLLIYGGEDIQSKQIFSDLLLLQTKPSKMWLRLPPPPNSKMLQPPPLAGHAAVWLDSKMFMFGGKTHEGVPTDELYILNEVNFLWSMPRIVGQKPPAVYGHTLCSFNAYNNKLENGPNEHDTLLLFGGKGIDSCSNDVYTFSLQRFEKNKWTKRLTTGRVPSPRCWHSAAIVDNRFVVFGGMDHEGNWFNDLYIMDIYTFIWQEVRITSNLKEVPTPRSHTRFVVFKHWGHEPPLLYLFGGVNENGALGDSYVFDMERSEWRTCRESGHKPQPRYGHSVDMINKSVLFLIGGAPYENAKALDIHVSYVNNLSFGGKIEVNTLPVEEFRDTKAERERKRREEEEEKRRKEVEEQRKREEEQLRIEKERLEKEKIEEERKRQEAERLLREQKEIEKLRFEEEKQKLLKQTEAEKKRLQEELENERRRISEEEKKLKKQQEELTLHQTQKTSDEERKKIEEQKRLDEQMQKLLEEKRRFEEEQKRVEEQKKKLEDDYAKLLEKERKRLEEEATLRIENERKRIEEEIRKQFETSNSSPSKVSALSSTGRNEILKTPPKPPPKTNEQNSSPNNSKSPPPIPPRPSKITTMSLARMNSSPALPEEETDDGAKSGSEIRLSLNERRLRRKASIGNGTLMTPQSEGGFARPLSTSGLSLRSSALSPTDELTKFRLFWLKLLDIMKELPTADSAQKSQPSKDPAAELQRYQEIEALVKEYQQKFNHSSIERDLNKIKEMGRLSKRRSMSETQTIPRPLSKQLSSESLQMSSSSSSLTTNVDSSSTTLEERITDDDLEVELEGSLLLDLDLQKKLLSSDFKYVSDLFSAKQVNEAEVESLLADLLFEFFDAHERLSDFMKWAITLEVQKTDTPEQLFRGHTVATHLLSRIFASESAINFLKSTVLLLIKDLESHTDNNNSKNNPTDDKDTVEFYLQAAKRFIETLQKELFIVPLEIREVMVAIKREVAAKFPEQDNVVIVVWFLRFLCPAILQPHVYGVTEEAPTPQLLQSLLFVSKLLQNVANGITTKLDNYGANSKEVKKFLDVHIPVLKDYAAKLTNEEEITLYRKILRANVKSNPITTSYIQHQKLVSVREMLIANDFITVDGRDKFYDNISKSSDDNESQKIKNRDSETKRENESVAPQVNALKRMRIFKEGLLESEENYVKDLNTILKLFVEPLSERKLLSPKEISYLFGDIKGLIAMNEELLTQLREIDSATSATQNIGKIFLKFTEKLKVYCDYCSQLSNLAPTLTSLRKENPKFHQFIEEKLADPNCRTLDLIALLSLPLARIHRYPVLLREIYKVTPPDHADIADLQKAISRIEEAIGEITQRRQVFENQQKLIRLSEQIIYTQKPAGFDLLDPKRKLIKQGSVEQLNATSDALAMIGFNNLIKKNEKRLLFLFNDFLLVVKEEKDHLLAKHCIQLLNCYVWADSSFDNVKYKDTAFGISRADKRERLTFAAITKKDRDDWIEKILECGHKLSLETNPKSKLDISGYRTQYFTSGRRKRHDK
jgi:hypothetical protein